MNQTFMKEKPIFPLVLSMALPMTISMLVNALYNIVDSYFVASISESAMTALSLVYPIQNVVTAVLELMLWWLFFLGLMISIWLIVPHLLECCAILFTEYF